ncbi:hypothetical protein IPA_02295 [Ignicoccus pacificus DSM 13166]|uniref:EamA domain-containing protein n=1 Tax=Ignicoccus pacificus DSM 13166 TaxID=940294 RepID=A0A977PJW2_9CREN|nr:hypothetical protein IPA_02295 [Ignicoccus pacificus DSM 13166]
MRKGALYVYSAAALWSTIGPASLGDPWSVSFFRLIFAGIASARFFKPSKDLTLLGLIIFPFYVSYVLSVNTVGVTLAVAMLYTAPAWVSLVEKLEGRGSILPALLASLGVYLLTGAPKLKENFLIALLPGLLYASLILYSKKLLNEWNEEDLLSGNVYASVLSLSLIPLVKLNLRPLLSGLYLGVICSTLAYLLFYRGLKEVEAWYASVAATLEPLLASLWGFLLGERISLISWGGFGLILLSQGIAYKEELSRT